MVNIAIGVYILFYIINALTIMGYIQGTLTLKQTSIGQTLGIYMVTLTAGLVAGLIITVKSGVLSSIGVIFMAMAYVGFMLSLLLQLKGFVEQHSQKKLGTNDYNRATQLEGLYRLTRVMILVGGILVLIGLVIKQPLLALLGVSIDVVLFSGQLQQSKRVVSLSRDLTLAERAAKVKQFNQAVEGDSIAELDNADKTIYKVSKRQLNKYLKKRS